MARKCMQRREQRREHLTAKFKDIRLELRAIINNPEKSLAEKMKAQRKLQLLPRDSSMVRKRNRCWQTGRARGVFRIVGLCRNMFRKYAMEGYIPGLHKASW